jgi:hypothetical protein
MTITVTIYSDGERGHSALHAVVAAIAAHYPGITVGGYDNEPLDDERSSPPASFDLEQSAWAQGYNAGILAAIDATNATTGNTSDRVEFTEPDPAPPEPLTLRSPRDVACPRCGAAAGEWCVTATGASYGGPSFYHQARKAAS